MSLAYHDFLAHKRIVAPPAGIEAPGELSDSLFPFQRDITTWALRRGRAAVFAGTGLGKTLMELSWAEAVAGYTGGRVLLFAPLGVAHQTVREAGKFGFSGIVYSTDQSAADASGAAVVITNYERLHLFDLTAFEGVVLDESSIIKSHEGQTRRVLTEACARIPYRLCATATPAPNDYVELGQHAEFLGVMSAKEMLSMWFVHNGSIRATSAANHGSAPEPEWRLKRHAERDFWAWVASWAVMIRHPRDLGYDQPGYDLPPLRMEQVTVRVDARDGSLFPTQARTLSERLSARRESLEPRVRAAAEIINAQPGRPWLGWCNLNAEADLLESLVLHSLQVAGSHRPEVKEDRLLGFCDGRPKDLITKASIGGWGMNWQHCADMVFVGLNDSFEQLYQATRRCWRFGQSKPVTAYLIAAETEGAVVANLKAKEAQFDEMYAAMAEHMRDLNQQAIRGGRVSTPVNVSIHPMEVPPWMQSHS